MRADSEEAIRRSIIHSLLEDLNEQESRTLENWLKTPEHQDFYKKISNREYVRCKMAGLELSDKEKARERLKMNIARRIERYRRRKWLGRVAGIVLLLCMGEGVWFYWQNEVKQTDQDLAERLTDSSLPVIRLASGKEIALNRDSAYNLDGGFLLAEDGYARYEPTANVKRADSSQYNEIRTPRGTDYKMILPDGTKVWMNAESVVRFPVVFPTGERRVACDGEVFFDVARDSLRPFRVETAGNVVKVLGTRFDIRHYEDEPYSAVLLSGSIRLSRGKHEVLLKPGEQAQLMEERWVVGKAGASATSWIDGYFLFDNRSLEYIMRELARWYDIEVFFVDSDKQNEYYSFEIERSSSLKQVMNILEKTRTLDVELKGRPVIIR